MNTGRRMMSRTLSLTSVVLVLLQSGLAAGRCHGHPDQTGASHHGRPPHVHAHTLLDLVLPESSGDEGDADDHDDAIDLPALTASTPPPAADPVGTSLLPVPSGVFTLGLPGSAPLLLGLPPPTAGPARPLYLTHCSLRN